MINLSVKSLLIFTFIQSLNGCATEEAWQIHLMPSEPHVQAVLSGEEFRHEEWLIATSQLPDLSVPDNVRPCCAFGDMQKVQVGPLPIPFFRLNNVISVDEMGPHKFASGIYHYTPASASASGVAGSENNGLLYTRQGGFIDLAHVRDSADDTIGLFFEMLANLGTEHRIELPAELGPRYVEMKAFDVSSFSQSQKWHIAANMAARIAYFKAESHEIAQWHGYSSFSQWPETISAYSIEDLYSNMLGAKLTLALIEQHRMLTETEYNQNLTLWIAVSLQQLGAVNTDQAKQALALVDGHWWDSTESIPSKYMILKRHYTMGDHQIPHVIGFDNGLESGLDKGLVNETAIGSDTVLLASSELSPLVTQTSPTPLSLPSEVEGVKLDDVARLVLEVDDGYAETFSHVPPALWEQRIEHIHFQKIADFAQQQDEQDLILLRQNNDK
ncbi:DUF4056 domain-containing protein [Photobacterium sanguinicancri]|uniref:DUF4056 domain-containing protein n=1 Tax=Photobacterium sanguinicancri TaxID=875932 RepID=UPI003D10ABDF